MELKQFLFISEKRRDGISFDYGKYQNKHTANRSLNVDLHHALIYTYQILRKLKIKC